MREFPFVPVLILEGNFRPETAFKLPSSLLDAAKGLLAAGLPVVAVFEKAYFSSSNTLAVSLSKDLAPIDFFAGAG